MATRTQSGPSSNDDSPSSTGDPNQEENPTNANFECNICLDTAKDAVISQCGHLFW